MRRFFLLIILCLIILISCRDVQAAGTLEWPDVVKITWNGYTDVYCFEDLVYCLLKSSVDSSDFADTVSSRGHSIWWWNSQSWSCIVQIDSLLDLATEALYFKNSSLTRYGAPMTLIGQEFWPPDELYADEDIREQWYLTGDWEPEDVNEDIHINLSPVFDDLEQRGHENVILGIIDNGIMWDSADGLLHPDLKSGRFNIGVSYDRTINNRSPHGTAVLSILAADAENTIDEDNNEGDWGMTGVNTESEVWIYKGVRKIRNPPDSIWFQQVAMQTEAFKHMVRNREPHIINQSSGFYPNEVRAEEDTLWEMAFTDLMEEERDMPLFVVAAGNSNDIGEEEVAFPARLAFTGEFEGFERGYAFIVCVSGISETGERHFSFDNGHNHVSLVAPSGTSDLWILAAWDPIWNHNAGLPEEYEPWFHFWPGGTSFAAPLVAGVASLVLSQDWLVNEERTLDAGDLRRIIEKTARDVNDTTEAYFDDEMGFGLVDCYAAVTNRDLYTWQLDDETWYYISSNVAIDDAFDKDTIPRVLEEIILDNTDYNNGLFIINSYNVQADSACVWKPGVREDNIGDWNVQRMYQIKLNDEDKYTDTLWICGQAEDITADIFLYDTDSTSGWNWVAYYPQDYEASADSALLSIATPGDSTSNLYLAKGQDGSFYSVDYSFCNLTMKPGEGYQMQLDEDVNDTLNYPAGDPDGIIERRKGSGEDLINTPQHFRFSSRTGDFLPILITRVVLNNRFPTENDEIGIFIADTLCVGAGLWQEGLIGFAAWMNDETTPTLDGFRNFNSLTFRYWDDSENEEIGQIGIETAAAAESNKEPSILVKELNFDGPVRKPEIPQDFALGPIYPNPFNSSTNIHYSLPSSQYVSLLLFNLSGRKIRTLYTGYSEAGKYRISLNGVNLPSGLYFIRFNAGTFEQTRKLELIR